jgi:hypothetical protein
MKEQLEQYVKRVKDLHDFCHGNEATTKASLIAPLFGTLGYDMSDPHECLPEYRADFGKGEKAATPVDWAFRLNSAFVFIVEAKEAGKKLKPYAEQLGMYFAKAAVKLGVYTNGVQWQFYSDLANQNIMDKVPFLTWDIANDDPLPLAFLTILHKSQFQPQLIRTFAERGHKQNLLVDELTRLLLEPSSEFIKLAVKNIETRYLHANVVEEWKPILKNAIHEWAKQQTLTMALQQPNTEPEQDGDESPSEVTDREYWESKATKATLLATDDFFKLVQEVEPKAMLNYNKYYIGLEIDGASRNFVVFRPQKKGVLMGLKLPLEKETDEQIAKAGFDTLTYDSQFKEYRIKLDVTVDDKQRELLLSLIRQAWEGVRKA